MRRGICVLPAVLLLYALSFRVCAQESGGVAARAEAGTAAGTAETETMAAAAGMAGTVAGAAGTTETEERQEPWERPDDAAVWDAFSLQEITDEINRMTDEGEMDYRAMLGQLMLGRFDSVGETVKQFFRKLFVGSAKGCRALFVRLLLLGIAAAVCSLFAELFYDAQVADTGFYIVYLLMLSVLLSYFRQATELAYSVLQNIADFIPLFVPAFGATIGLSCGAGAAAGWYTLLMAVEGLVLRILKDVAVPLVYVYLILSVMNGLWQEEKLTLLLDLLKRALEAGLKLLTGMVAGLSLVQSMILPVLDSMKGEALQKAVSALPGIGNLSDQVYRMFMGSCILIKNSLGLLFCIGLAAVCAGPLVRILIMIAVIKLAAALLGIISDKRIVHCMNRIGDSGLLLGKVITCAVSMLFLLLAIACFLYHRSCI